MKNAVYKKGKIMREQPKTKTRGTYRKWIVAVALISICLICSGCAVGGSLVPSFEEQIVNIDNSLLDSIGVLPLHTYYKYELVNEKKSADSYTSTIRFFCTEGMFLADGELELHYSYEREADKWCFENATFDHEKQLDYFQCNIAGKWVWEGVTTRELNAWEEYGEEVEFFIMDYMPPEQPGDGYGTFTWVLSNVEQRPYVGEGFIDYTKKLQLIMTSDSFNPGAFNINPITMRCSEFGMENMNRALVKVE